MEDVWTMKKQLPDFMGIDPVGWINAAERFFEKNEVPSRDKLQWAFMSMEDEEAMLWFIYWNQEHVDADWKSFSRAMIGRFGAQMKQSLEGLILENLKAEKELSKTMGMKEEQSVKMTETHDDGEEFRVKEIDHESEKITPERLETPNSEVSVKKMSAVHRRIEQVVVLEPPPTPLFSDQPVVVLPRPKPSDQNSYMDGKGSLVKLPHPSESSDSDQLASTLPRREPPPKPPDLSSSVDREREGKVCVEKRRNVRLTVGESSSSEPPYAGDNSIHEHGGIVSEGEKVLERLRAKWTIREFNIFLNLLGQMHKSLPSILHNYNLLQVLSSDQLTFSFLFDASPIEYLFSATCHDYKMQELSNTTESESIASHQKGSQSFNSCYVCEEESQSFVKIREFVQDIVGYGSSLPLEKLKQVRYKEYQKVAILSVCTSPLCKCFGRHIKGFSVKLELGALDKDVIAIVNSYFICGNWAVVLEGFDDKRVWNLIACNSVTDNLLSAFPDSLVLQDGKDMHVCVVKICSDMDKFLATVLVDREYQEVDITSDCSSILSICFVKLEVDVHDREEIKIVNTYF
ncbi:hypothetical protein L195_g036538, partial [Trifolium pratense]